MLTWVGCHSNNIGLSVLFSDGSKIIDAREHVLNLIRLILLQVLLLAGAEI